MQSIAEHATAPGTGIFRNGGPDPTNVANFDQNYDPINGLDDLSNYAPYVVSDGDTLASVAQAVWGDASLWYLIAEANGLTSSGTLTAGQVLHIPNKVTNIHNSSSIYKVYDPNKAMGDTSPSTPAAAKPAKKSSGGCGFIGQVILFVVAIAVTFVTAGAMAWALAPAGSIGGLGAGIGAVMGGTLGAAGLGTSAIIGIGAASAAVGSMVSQGIGVATGLQDKFSWGAVAMAAIGGGVGASLAGTFSGLGGIGSAVARGVVGNVISQGIGLATGLQKKFDWAGVAAAGVSAAVLQYVSDNIDGAGVGAHDVSGPNPDGSVTTVHVGYQPASTMNTFISGMAGNIAYAATKSLIDGSDFGDNIIQGLPSVIGQTIGNMVAGSLASDDESVHVTGHKGDLNSLEDETVSVTGIRGLLGEPGGANGGYATDAVGGSYGDVAMNGETKLQAKMRQILDGKNAKITSDDFAPESDGLTPEDQAALDQLTQLTLKDAPPVADLSKLDPADLGPDDLITITGEPVPVPTANPFRKHIEELMQNRETPEWKAFRDTISSTEHAGYDSVNNGIPFNHSFDPENDPYPQRGAGIFQITHDTYNDYAPKLGITDGKLTQVDQDLIAQEILTRYHALDDVLQGDIASALPKIYSQWESLPAGYGLGNYPLKTPQPFTPFAHVIATYNSRLEYYKNGGH